MDARVKAFLRLGIILLAVAAYGIIGCSLGSTLPYVTPTVPAPDVSQATPVFIDARSNPDSPVQSEQLADSVQAQSQPQAASQSQTIINQTIYVISPSCAPRYDWSLYYVRYGDTLGRIAAWYGTSVATLAYANCIADPNRIYVGQALRVPYYSQPHPYPYPNPHPHPNPYPYPYPYPTYTPVPPPPPTPIPPVIIGTALWISSYAAVNNNVYTLNPGELITISWNSAFPTATRQVAFEIIAPTGGATVMGIDTNLGDGASILWNAVPGTQGTVHAIASFSGGYPPQSSDAVYFIVPGP